MLIIPKKEDKLKSQLIDHVRILAWQNYKSNNSTDLTGLELYEVFNAEWKAHEIHKMTVSKIEKFIADLGYTIDELVENSKDYYVAKKAYKVKLEETHPDF